MPWRQISFVKVSGYQNRSMELDTYLWFIEDGDSSVYHAVVTGVPLYGRYVQEVECANNAIKCYRNCLGTLCKNHPEYQG